MAQAFHWELMDEMNPELHTKFSALSAQINVNEVIPKKYREMMILSMACVLRCMPAVKAHATNCVKLYGCTKEELYCVVASAITMGGIPAYRESCAALEELFNSL